LSNSHFETGQIKVMQESFQVTIQVDIWCAWRGRDTVLAWCIFNEIMHMGLCNLQMLHFILKLRRAFIIRTNEI